MAPAAPHRDALCTGSPPAVHHTARATHHQIPHRPLHTPLPATHRCPLRIPPRRCAGARGRKSGSSHELMHAGNGRWAQARPPSPGQKNKITPEVLDSLTACGSGTTGLRHRVHLSSRYWLLVREGAFLYRCYCCKRQLQLQLQFRRRFCFSHASLPPKRVGRPVCVVKVFTYNTLPYICF